MPYISSEDRDAVAKYGPNTVGELTFAVTELVLDYLSRYSGVAPRFADYAEAIAALECTQLELYRRSIAPYEDKAIERNGDLGYPRRG